jgi:serine phosphatase RsbU (regulator of sigma subunit)
MQKVPGDAPLREFVRRLHSELKRFAGSAGPQDDVTLLLLRRNSV